MDIASNDLCLSVLNQTNPDSAHCKLNAIGCVHTAHLHLMWKTNKKRFVRSNFGLPLSLSHTSTEISQASHCRFPSNARIRSRISASLRLLVAFISYTTRNCNCFHFSLCRFCCKCKKAARLRVALPLQPLKIQNYWEITQWHLAWRLENAMKRNRNVVTSHKQKFFFFSTIHFVCQLI